jgi:hypothetical protein
VLAQPSQDLIAQDDVVGLPSVLQGSDLPPDESNDPWTHRGAVAADVGCEQDVGLVFT